MTIVPRVSSAVCKAPRFRMQEAPLGFIRLDLNESPVGASPAALAAMHDVSVGRYPGSGGPRLRAALAGRYNLDPSSVACGQGSDELIRLLCRALLDPGDEAVYEAFGFGVFPAAVAAAGGRPVRAAARGIGFDIDGLLSAVGPRTRMVLLANPNNPTGVTAPWSDVERLLAALPERVVLVHDAAYAEYVVDPGYEAGHDRVGAEPRLVVLRTFSKAHGLAGLRVGWMHAHPVIIDAVDAVRPIYNVSAAAEAAAIATLGDDEQVPSARRASEASVCRYVSVLRDRCITAILGDTNFVCFPVAPGLAEAFAGAGIAVHALAAYGLDHGVRVSFGTEAEDEAALAVLRRWSRPAPEPLFERSLA